MKTAITIPDDIFRKAQAFARRRRMTRSALFTEAIKNYIQPRRRNDVTAKLNRVYAEHSSRLDPILEELQQRSIPRENWE